MQFIVSHLCILDISMLNLRTLRLFVAVAERLNVSKAAEALHISQSALSRQLQGLESSLGLQLFDRVGKRMTLTAEGEDLLPRIATLLDQAQRLSTRMEGMAKGQIGVLRIGATPQSIETLLSRVLMNLKRKYPAIEVSLVEGSNTFLLEQIEQGGAHVAIATLPEFHDLESQSLFTGQLYAAFPAGHPLVHRKAIDIRELTETPLLTLRKGFMTRSIFDRACSQAGIRPRSMLDSDSTQTLLALANAGLGVAIISSTALTRAGKSIVVPLTLDDQPLELLISAVWNPRRYKSTALTTLLEELAADVRRDYRNDPSSSSLAGYHAENQKPD